MRSLVNQVIIAAIGVSMFTGCALRFRGFLDELSLDAKTSVHVNMGRVTTIAGNYYGGDGSWLEARFNFPSGITSDTHGNSYITDQSDYTIRKITANGVVTTVAGIIGTSGCTDGGPGAATFTAPTAIAVDPYGNLFVVDQACQSIRKVTPDGTVSTFAGSGSAGAADGTGTAASFNNPLGIAIDPITQDLYVSDTFNYTIRKISPATVVTTFAGAAGGAGVADGTGAAASFFLSIGLVMDSGNLFVADYGSHTIRQVTVPGAVVSTIAGTAALSGTADGTGASGLFKNPKVLAMDASGNLFVGDSGNNTIRKIAAGGVVTTLAGTPGTSGNTDASGAAARFGSVNGMTVNSNGTLLVTDSSNNTIRTISGSGAVVTVSGHVGKDGVGKAATFKNPFGVAVDSHGNRFVTDYAAYTIRKITPSGVVTTFVGTDGVTGFADGTGTSASFSGPAAIAIAPDDTIYISDLGSNTIRKITPAGVVTTIAGTHGVTGCVDGTGAAVQMGSVYGMVTDPVGNVYFTDLTYHVVRKMTPAGVVSTIAGTASAPGFTDGIGATARFSMPSGITRDSSGNLFILDTANATIRKMLPDGTVTTFAGSVGVVGHTDGVGTSATFYTMYGITSDSNGTLYVTDASNYNVRAVSPEGVVSTLAGAIGVSKTVDGVGSAAAFNSPVGICASPNGDLAVAELNGTDIRLIQ